MLAVLENDLALVEIFLDHGADINTTDNVMQFKGLWADAYGVDGANATDCSVSNGLFASGAVIAGATCGPSSDRQCKSDSVLSSLFSHSIRVCSKERLHCLEPPWRSTH